MFVFSLMSVKPQNCLLQWNVHELAKTLVSGEGTCIYELEITGSPADDYRTSKLSMAVGEGS